MKKQKLMKMENDKYSPIQSMVNNDSVNLLMTKLVENADAFTDRVKNNSEESIEETLTFDYDHENTMWNPVIVKKDNPNVNALCNIDLTINNIYHSLPIAAKNVLDGKWDRQLFDDYVNTTNNFASFSIRNEFNNCLLQLIASTLYDISTNIDMAYPDIKFSKTINDRLWTSNRNYQVDIINTIFGSDMYDLSVLINNLCITPKFEYGKDGYFEMYSEMINMVSNKMTLLFYNFLYDIIIKTYGCIINPYNLAGIMEIVNSELVSFHDGLNHLITTIESHNRTMYKDSVNAIADYIDHSGIY